MGFTHCVMNRRRLLLFILQSPDTHQMTWAKKHIKQNFDLHLTWMMLVLCKTSPPTPRDDMVTHMAAHRTITHRGTTQSMKSKGITNPQWVQPAMHFVSCNFHDLDLFRPSFSNPRPLQRGVFIRENPSPSTRFSEFHYSNLFVLQAQKQSLY